MDVVVEGVEVRTDHDEFSQERISIRGKIESSEEKLISKCYSVEGKRPIIEKI